MNKYWNYEVLVLWNVLLFINQIESLTPGGASDKVLYPDVLCATGDSKVSATL